MKAFVNETAKWYTKCIGYFSIIQYSGNCNERKHGFPAFNICHNQDKICPNRVEGNRTRKTTEWKNILSLNFLLSVMGRIFMMLWANVSSQYSVSLQSHACHVFIFPVWLFRTDYWPSALYHKHHITLPKPLIRSHIVNYSIGWNDICSINFFTF